MTVQKTGWIFFRIFSNSINHFKTYLRLKKISDLHVHSFECSEDFVIQWLKPDVIGSKIAAKDHHTIQTLKCSMME